ncbi:MAG TPA: hypothetical protein VGL53_12960 [Bryobacteraceae bacterium]
MTTAEFVAKVTLPSGAAALLWPGSSIVWENAIQGIRERWQAEQKK